jgi:serine/threonine protein kinase/Tol biopolymer transport system component
MPDARWIRAKQVFHEALDHSGPARGSFVAAACGGDAALRAQVEALLSAHDEAGDFMASAGEPGGRAAEAAATLAAGAAPESPGARVGPYKLLQTIGEGGFGTVYMAEQEHPIRRRVALKIIKLGMDTKEVIARFEAERQALALMDHPSIAKVFDAGATASGRPYFVMELVKGVAITDYCDSNHLNTRERLELFGEVCRAIHHAHEKGIIHRDIKPSNVLVTLHDGTPVPKIIDFGVAKATNQRLTEKTLFTAYGAFVGTPAYMSPEQAELSGLEIDRRSDIYALGVLLYELLTGTTPFEAETLRARALAEVMRIIREDDPPTPSARLHTLGSRLIDVATRRQVEPGALQKLVRGDLDWIVMKAIEKDRQRRYDSASDLADDLGRHFRDEPVSARRPSAAYRVQKFARRKRVPLVAAASVAGALLLGGYAARLGVATPAPAAGPATLRVQPLAEIDDVTRDAWRDFQGLSPDGTRALFGDYSGGQNFAVQDLRAGSFGLLTNLDWSTAWTCCAAWSPQSDAIAYVQYPFAATSPPEVRVTTLDGQSRLLFRGESARGGWASIDAAAWTPDGRALLVRAAHADGSGVIATLPADGGPLTEIRQLRVRVGDTWFDRPALSPDGRFVAFAETENAGARDIHVMTLDGRREWRVTEHAADDSRPLWSPDGQYLAFVSTRGGAAALWAVPMEDGKPAAGPFRIRDGMQDVWLLNWTDRGITYNQDTRTSDIFTSERGPNGWSAPRQLPYERTGRNTNAVWSPDGTQLAFIAAIPGDVARRYVVVQPAAGGPAREYRIPSDRFAYMYDLRWFGNGAGLGVSAPDNDGTTAVFRLTVETGAWDVIPLALRTWTRIEWNHDGSAFYYARWTSARRASIHERNVVTGSEREIYAPDEPINTIRGLRFSADRRQLAFYQRWDEAGVDTATVVLLDPATGAHRKLTSVRATRPSELGLSSLAWAPDDAGLVLLVTARGRSELRFAPLDGGAVRPLGDVPMPGGGGSFVAGMHWSPDGRRLAFVLNEQPGRAFVLEHPLAGAPAHPAQARR